MSMARSDNTQASAFIESIVNDAVLYYKQQDEKGLDSLLRKALAPIFLSGSSAADSTIDFDMKESVLNAAISQYKEKKQEAAILRKAFSALSLSKSASGEDLLALKEDIILGAVKYYQQTQQDNLVLNSLLFAILACQLPKIIALEQEKWIQQKLGGYSHVIKLTDVTSDVLIQNVWDKNPVEVKKIEKTVTEVSSGYPEKNKEEVQRIIKNSLSAAKEITFSKEKYPLFEDALFALKGTRRFNKAISDSLSAIQNTFESKADDFLDLTPPTEIILDEITKLFHSHDFVIPGSITEKYETLCEGVEKGYGILYQDLVNQLVIPYAIAGQAELFLKEYGSIFLKCYPKLEPMVQVCLSESGEKSLPTENRLEIYDLLMNNDKILPPAFRRLPIEQQKTDGAVMAEQKRTVLEEQKAPSLNSRYSIFTSPPSNAGLVTIPRPVVVIDERKRPSLERKLTPDSPQSPTSEELPPGSLPLSQKSFISQINDLTGDARRYTTKAVNKTTKMVTKVGKALGSWFS